MTAHPCPRALGRSTPDPGDPGQAAPAARPTGGCGRGLAAGRQAVEGRVVAVLDDGVHRLRLLQLRQQLLHGLDGVVPAQVDRHLLDLRTKQRRAAFQSPLSSRR